MLAAALREGFRGPVFIQGDHFQVNAKKFAADPATEVDAVKALAREAIAAGFYNIDIDTSTLVDISQADARRAAAAELRSRASTFSAPCASSSPRASRSPSAARSARSGTQNSTVEELRAYMDGFNRTPAGGHGGAVEDQRAVGHVARRRRARRRLDRRREARSRHARDDCRRWRATSTDLPARCSTARRRCRTRAFNNFPKRETAEIHLATNFQNMLFDHMPADAARDDLRVAGGEREGRAEGDRLRRAVLSTRRARRRSARSSGSCGICRTTRRRRWRAAYDEKFAFLFDQLAIGNTAAIVARFVKPPAMHRARSERGRCRRRGAGRRGAERLVEADMASDAHRRDERVQVDALWLETLQRICGRARRTSSRAR